MMFSVGERHNKGRIYNTKIEELYTKVEPRMTRIAKHDEPLIIISGFHQRHPRLNFSIRNVDQRLSGLRKLRLCFSAARLYVDKSLR